MLERAGATVAAAGPALLTVTGLGAERIVALLSGHAVPFSEVSAHRATLEEAYMELTRDAVEFRGRGRPGRWPGDHRARRRRPPAPARRRRAGDSFAGTLRAEWTKFRTVRGWVIGMIVAALVTVLIGLPVRGGQP